MLGRSSGEKVVLGSFDTEHLGVPLSARGEAAVWVDELAITRDVVSGPPIPVVPLFLERVRRPCSRRVPSVEDPLNLGVA